MDKLNCDWDKKKVKFFSMAVWEVWVDKKKTKENLREKNYFLNGRV